MAILRIKDVRKMTEQEKKEKLKELKLELVKANVTANRTNAKTKEIKRAISRLITTNTFNKSSKERKLEKINNEFRRIPPTIKH